MLIRCYLCLTCRTAKTATEEHLASLSGRAEPICARSRKRKPVAEHHLRKQQPAHMHNQHNKKVKKTMSSEYDCHLMPCHVNMWLMFQINSPHVKCNCVTVKPERSNYTSSKFSSLPFLLDSKRDLRRLGAAQTQNIHIIEYTKLSNLACMRYKPQSYLRSRVTRQIANCPRVYAAS